MIRKTITAAVMIAMAGLCYAGPALGATTGPAAHHQAAGPLFNPGSGFTLVPDVAGNGDSITAEGVGSQTETEPNGTSWSTTAATHGYKIMPANGAHCLTQVGSALDIENCAAGDGAQEWNFNGTPNSTTITDYTSGQAIGVFSPDGPRPVDVENQHSGFYAGWVVAS